MEFRDKIPAYKPPDRAAWERKHGVAPYSLGRVHQKYVNRALRAIRRDYSTIEAKEAIAADVSLEFVCDSVRDGCDVPESSVVFFDPADEQFWVYPTSKR
jgi:hypothetical protein